MINNHRDAFGNYQLFRDGLGQARSIAALRLCRQWLIIVHRILSMYPVTSTDANCRGIPFVYVLLATEPDLSLTIALPTIPAYE